MPELPDEMYCSQQICIPPTFPYLLRQYAKAAIRTQPTDLLKWSTAYFRCLSLNIPPPVKPRLEYPIPRDFVGITPGWLKALNYQLQNNQTVPFRILWDRWVGSCLHHNTLVQILCLGQFVDNTAVPWNRFLALCAAHLTDNLTQTMILICEILTEEPEGGSAMITLETFLDLYKFLAAIDASHHQTLVNLYFTDAALALEEEKKKKAKKVKSIEEIKSSESSTPPPEEVPEEVVEVKSESGERSIVSCPNIASDEALAGADVYVAGGPPHPVDSAATVDFEPVIIPPTPEKEDSDEDEDGDASTVKFNLPDDEEDEDEDDKNEGSEDEDADEEREPQEEDEDAERAKEDKDVSAAKEQAAEVPADGTVDVGHFEHEPEPGVYDYLLNAEDAYPEGVDDVLLPPQAESEESLEPEEKEQVEEEEEAAVELIEVEPIPGIGPTVPPELVEAVVYYFTKVSAEDHGMAMPRHIRHYSCPPLEVLD